MLNFIPQFKNTEDKYIPIKDLIKGILNYTGYLHKNQFAVS